MFVLAYGSVLARLHRRMMMQNAMRMLSWIRSTGRQQYLDQQTLDGERSPSRAFLAFSISEPLVIASILMSQLLSSHS